MASGETQEVADAQALQAGFSVQTVFTDARQAALTAGDSEVEAARKGFEAAQEWVNNIPTVYPPE